MMLPIEAIQKICKHEEKYEKMNVEMLKETNKMKFNEN